MFGNNKNHNILTLQDTQIMQFTLILFHFPEEQAKAWKVKIETDNEETSHILIREESILQTLINGKYLLH